MKLKTLSTRDLMGSMSGSKSGKQLLSLYVDSIDDAKVNGDIVEQVVGGLLLDDLDTLTSHAYKIMDYGISVYVKSKCYCGHENEVSIYKYYGGQDVRLPFRFNPGVASES